MAKRKLKCKAFTVDKGSTIEKKERKKCDDESIFFHLYATNVA